MPQSYRNNSSLRFRVVERCPTISWSGQWTWEKILLASQGVECMYLKYDPLATANKYFRWIVAREAKYPSHKWNGNPAPSWVATVYTVQSNDSPVGKRSIAQKRVPPSRWSSQRYKRNACWHGAAKRFEGWSYPNQKKKFKLNTSISAARFTTSTLLQQHRNTTQGIDLGM